MIPLGILAAAGAAAGSSFELISTTLISSNTSSVTFDVSTLASTYKHLQLRYMSRDSNSTNGGNYIFVRFNGDTGSNYSTHRMWGNGSAINANNTTGAGQAYLLGLSSGDGTGQFAAGIVDLLDPFSTSKNKTCKASIGYHSTTGEKRIYLSSSMWISTSAITSILLQPDTASFVSGSRFSLYGVKG